MDLARDQPATESRWLQLYCAHTAREAEQTPTPGSGVKLRHQLILSGAAPDGHLALIPPRMVLVLQPQIRTSPYPADLPGGDSIT